MNVYLKNVRIVDGTGSPAIENGLLVYCSTVGNPDKHGILYVGPMNSDVLAKAEKSDRIMDLKGEYTVTPGLVNTHVHLDLQMPGAGFRLDPLGPAFRALKAYRRAAEALEVGVTTLRNVGGGDFFDVAIKNAVDKGMLLGPRVICCGWTLMAHGGHGSQDYGAIECTGPVEFAKNTRLNLIAGCDCIKVGMTGGLEGAHEGLCDRQVTNEELEAVIWVAHQAGKKVAAHLSDDQTIYDSVSRGLDSVEHGYAMKERTVKLIAEKGKYYTPTLSVSSEDSIDYMNKHGFPARNFANSQVTSDYFLILDSDEYASSGLLKYLRAYIERENPAEGVRIPYKNELLGKVLHSYSKRGILRFFKNIIKWNYYTTLELEKLTARNKHFSMTFLVTRSVLEFIKMYFIKQGFRDGVHGFIFAIIAAHYKFMAIVKLWEYEMKNEDYRLKRK